MPLKFDDYDKVNVLGPEPGAKLQTAPTVERDGFFLAKHVDIHAMRRVQILDKYPQIKELYGTDMAVAIGVTVNTIIQTFIAMHIGEYSWPVILIVAYWVGATIGASQSLGLHCLCHDEAHPNPHVNRFFELVLNLPLVIPFAATYKVYHYDHHRYQGVDGVDTDLPTPGEAELVSNPKYPYIVHCMTKTLFLMCNLAIYGLRPLILRPENVQRAQKSWSYLANNVLQIIFTYAMFHYYGIYSVIYLLLSLLFTAIHPTAGHFIGEHYVFDNKMERYQIDAPVETHSYRGFWNLFLWNGGYHIEHHDFPKIPYRKLPEVTKIAPEFYPKTMETQSWSKLLLRFIFDNNVTLWSRVKRPSYGHQKVNPSKQITDFKTKCQKDDAVASSAAKASFDQNTIVADEDNVDFCETPPLYIQAAASTPA